MTNKLKFGQIKPNLGIPINWGNPLANGLVGYWPMLEGTGNTVQDLSGNGNDGNLLLILIGLAVSSAPASLLMGMRIMFCSLIKISGQL